MKYHPNFMYMYIVLLRGSIAEEVVQVHGFCIRTLHLLVISVMIIRVMAPSVPSCVDVNYSSFKICVFRVVKSPLKDINVRIQNLYTHTTSSESIV